MHMYHLFLSVAVKSIFFMFFWGKRLYIYCDIAKELWLATASNIQALVLISMLLIEDCRQNTSINACILGKIMWYFHWRLSDNNYLVQEFHVFDMNSFSSLEMIMQGFNVQKECSLPKKWLIIWHSEHNTV